MKFFDPAEFREERTTTATQFGASNDGLPEYLRNAIPADYPADQGFFFNRCAVRKWGKGGNDLPPALRPNPSGAFNAPLSDVGAKYGIRNYIKEVTRSTHTLRESFASRPPKPGPHVLLNRARNVLAALNRAYSFNVDVRQKRTGADKGIALMFSGPIPATCHVKRPDEEEIHTENLLLGENLDLFLSETRLETQISLAGIGFTQHALTRIWERSDQRHKGFHTAMIDAWRTVEAHVAIAELSTILSERPDDLARPYLGVPFLDGFLILSERTVLLDPDINRFCSRSTKTTFGRMRNVECDYYGAEVADYVDGRPILVRPLWLAATFMAANDIGDYRRVLAAERLREHLSGIDTRKYVDLWHTLYADADQDMPLADIKALKPEFVLDLQDEMLPRKDPPAKRIYALSNMREAW